MGRIDNDKLSDITNMGIENEMLEIAWYKRHFFSTLIKESKKKQKLNPKSKIVRAKDSEYKLIFLCRWSLLLFAYFIFVRVSERGKKRKLKARNKYRCQFESFT